MALINQKQNLCYNSRHLREQTLQVIIVTLTLFWETGSHILSNIAKNGVSYRSHHTGKEMLFRSVEGTCRGESSCACFCLHLVTTHWHFSASCRICISSYGGFLKLGVPLNHPFIDGFSMIKYYKSSIWRYLYFKKPPCFQTTPAQLQDLQPSPIPPAARPHVPRQAPGQTLCFGHFVERVRLVERIVFPETNCLMS